MIDFIKNRYIYFAISAFFVLISLFFFFFKELNLWIDMTWWTQSEYSYSWELDISDVIEEITNLALDFNLQHDSIINNTSAYKVSGENQLVIIAWFGLNIEEKLLESYKEDFRNQITNMLRVKNDTIILDRYISIWKSFWDYIKNTAIITLIIALIAISFYIAWAFLWIVSGINPMIFALIALITLFHDVLVSAWLYIIAWSFFKEFQIDTFFITAMLTILWYSINDTIVIFDRIRYNLKAYWWKTKKLKEIINMSIKENITRSLYTSLTLIFVLVWIFFFWPESLRGFMLALILWTIIWTYSSIFIAAPMLYEINKNKQLKKYEKKVVSDEDKIVV